MGGEVSVLVEAMTSSETANALVEQAATVQLNQTVEEDFFDSYYPSSGSCSQGYQKMTGGSQDVYTDFPTEFQAGIRLRAVTVGEYGYSTWQVTRKSYQGEGGSIMCEEGTESRTGGSYSREKRATFTFDIQKVVHQKLSGRYVYGRGFLTVIPPDPNENFSGGLVLSCTGPLGWEKPCPDGLTEETAVYAIREYLGFEIAELEWAVIEARQKEMGLKEQQQVQDLAERARREEAQKRREEEAKSKGLFER